jgi:hypothetical protein
MAEVYFGLHGTGFAPDAVTRIVGLEPTGVVLPRSHRRGTTWKISTGKVARDLIDVYEMSSDLVARLQPNMEGILKAKAQFDLSAFLQVVLIFDVAETKSTPTIGFDGYVVSFLSSVGASIDIDTYVDAP